MADECGLDDCADSRKFLPLIMTEGVLYLGVAINWVHLYCGLFPFHQELTDCLFCRKESHRLTNYREILTKIEPRMPGIENQNSRQQVQHAKLCSDLLRHKRWHLWILSRGDLNLCLRGPFLRMFMWEITNTAETENEVGFLLRWAHC